MKNTQTVVVVGGGTAGWLTAGRIAAEHKKRKSNAPIEVLLIESPSTPIVGVGEGTWPTMRATLQALGIRETDFIRECDGTFKQGAKFAKWSQNDDDDFYYHPLMIPQGFPKKDLATDWLLGESNDSFSNAVCFQERLCELSLAPKLISTPEYACVANYSYHLDAGKFASFLQAHCTSSLGVKHVVADVIEVVNDLSGDIDYLRTEHKGDIAGDLFIDCTGFHALLIDKHYKVPLNDCSDVLEIDKAIATHVAYDTPESPIASHTISTGQSAGWVWDIGLRNRRGVGYVYCSKYISEDEALSELTSYIGGSELITPPRTLDIKAGYRRVLWHRNCVAVGLSAGFLEPLEASAIVMVELSAAMIAEQFPATRDVMDIVAKRFNQTFIYRWERIVDFLKLHYILSKREEPFWKSMAAAERTPESLKDLMKLWRYQVPSDLDFTSNNEVFPAASYQYVLYGMGFSIDQQRHRRSVLGRQEAQREFAQNQHVSNKAISHLPSHRELINKIHEFGLQPI